MGDLSVSITRIKHELDVSVGNWEVPIEEQIKLYVEYTDLLAPRFTRTIIYKKAPMTFIKTYCMIFRSYGDIIVYSNKSTSELKLAMRRWDILIELLKIK